MLSDDEFQRCLHQFIHTSDCLKDGWFLDTVKNQILARKKTQVTVPEVSNVPHLTKAKDGQVRKGKSAKTITPDARHVQEEPFDVLEECAGDLFSEEDDSSCMPQDMITSKVLNYEYHILYSESYAVPVLYLNVFNSSGQRIHLDEVWDLCPNTFQPYLKDNKWTTLTQQEHPLLGTPFMMLHPCHTAELMSQVNKGSGSHNNVKSNYLVTWLSTMGPLVGLNLSQKYAIPMEACEKNPDGSSICASGL